MQGQGQGPSLQGPGQGQGLDLQGQGLHLQLLTVNEVNCYQATTMNTK